MTEVREHAPNSTLILGVVVLSNAFPILFNAWLGLQIVEWPTRCATIAARGAL